MASKQSSPRLLYLSIGAAATALAAITFWYFSRGGPSITAGDRFFSEDQGKTFFTDSSANLPPFSRDGKEVLGASVFVDSAGKPFVGYLERYTEAGKTRAREMMAERDAGKGTPGNDSVLFANMELKRPSDKEWTRANDPRAASVRKVMCPDQPAQPAMPYVDPNAK